MACSPSKKQSINDELTNYFSKEFSADEPGGAILVMKGEEIVYSGAFGVADIITKEKITANTLFNTGSISKTFVSNTILTLAHENKLSLNDSLIKYFPDFKNQELAKKVTILNLLTHSSGLPDNRRIHHDSVFLLTAKDQENFAPILLNDSLLFEPDRITNTQSCLQRSGVNHRKSYGSEMAGCCS
jgi:Beta-lactamase class C and other penicillin binding proteins